MARPKVQIDEKQVRDLAMRHWSQHEIAAHFGVNQSQISRRFASIIEECRQLGNAKLKDILWSKVNQGDNRMIELALDRFLGKVPTTHVFSKQEALNLVDSVLESSGEGKVSQSQGDTEETNK